MSIVVVHAHPYPARSHAGGALIEALAGLPGLDLRSLYHLYPDFDVDPEAERRALERADLVVWSHPLYWYSTPALLKHWFDVVLVHGWAYGEGGAALAGKRCLWAVTAGESGSIADGAEPLASFARVVESIARHCSMHWLEPFVVDGTDRIGEEALAEAARRFRARIERELR